MKAGEEAVGRKADKDGRELLTAKIIRGVTVIHRKLELKGEIFQTKTTSRNPGSGDVNDSGRLSWELILFKSYSE